MTTINREVLKERFQDLIAVIQSMHVMGPEIEKELFVKHKPVVGLCHTRAYFIIAGAVYMQYTMDHIIVDVESKQLGRSVQEVIFYDNYIEYEHARIKAMSGVKAEDQTGLHLN